MKKKKCLDCGCIIEEGNDYEAYDLSGTDAIWDDSRKGWICQSYKDERDGRR